MKVLHSFLAWYRLHSIAIGFIARSSTVWGATMCRSSLPWLSFPPLLTPQSKAAPVAAPLALPAPGRPNPAPRVRDDPTVAQKVLRVYWSWEWRGSELRVTSWHGQILFGLSFLLHNLVLLSSLSSVISLLWSESFSWSLWKNESSLRPGLVFLIFSQGPQLAVELWSRSWTQNSWCFAK